MHIKQYGAWHTVDIQLIFFEQLSSSSMFSTNLFSNSPTPAGSISILKMVSATQQRIFPLLQHCHCLELFNLYY